MGGNVSFDFINFFHTYTFIAVIVVFLYVWLFIILYSCFHDTHRHSAAYAAADPPCAPPSNGGLELSAIRSLPTFKFAADTDGSSKKRSCWSECVVCLGAFEDNETLRLMPNCGHVFHSQCVDVWLLSHATCPYCRAVVSPLAGESPEVRIAVAPPTASS